MRADVVAAPGRPQVLIAGPMTDRRAVMRVRRTVSELTGGMISTDFTNPGCTVANMG